MYNYNCLSARPRDPRHKRSGVTLVEILIVTVVIALMAAVSFPVYKIIQQREKEKRLRKILGDVRAAIGGRKSALSSREFTDGYRTYVRNYGLAKLTDVASKTLFLQSVGRKGYGYPGTIASLFNPPFSFDVPLDSVSSVTILVDRKFLRPRSTGDGLPPHPFLSWNPNATWTKVLHPLNNQTIINIRSQGAGMALNGSLTDEW